MYVRTTTKYCPPPSALETTDGACKADVEDVIDYLSLLSPEMKPPIPMDTEETVTKVIYHNKQARKRMYKEKRSNNNRYMFPEERVFTLLHVGILQRTAQETLPTTTNS